MVERACARCGVQTYDVDVDAISRRVRPLCRDCRDSSRRSVLFLLIVFMVVAIRILW